MVLMFEVGFIGSMRTELLKRGDNGLLTCTINLIFLI